MGDGLMVYIPANEKICRIHPPGPPCFWRAGQGAAAKIAAPFPAAAEKGSPEGQVPLAPSAQDRPPRRRTERQTLTHTSIFLNSSLDAVANAFEVFYAGLYIAQAGVRISRVAFLFNRDIAAVADVFKRFFDTRIIQ